MLLLTWTRKVGALYARDRNGRFRSLAPAGNGLPCATKGGRLLAAARRARRAEGRGGRRGRGRGTNALTDRVSMVREVSGNGRGAHRDRVRVRRITWGNVADRHLLDSTLRGHASRAFDHVRGRRRPRRAGRSV